MAADGGGGGAAAAGGDAVDDSPPVWALFLAATVSDRAASTPAVSNEPYESLFVA